MRKLLFSPIVLGVLLGIAPTATADPVLDQVFVPTYGFMHAELRDGFLRAQTFTIGVTGLLTRFEVLLSAPGDETPATFGIYSTTAGIPNIASGLLATATIYPSRLTDAAMFHVGDVSAFGLMVTAGEVYAVAFTSPGGPATWRGAADGDALDVAHYQFGAMYGPGWTGPSEALPIDLGFRTWVDPGGSPPAVVPEPASLLLLGTGLLGVVRAVRRKRG